MKVLLKTISTALLLAALLCGLSGCSSVTLLKNGDFSKEYRDFIKHMQQTPPVSLSFEQYLKPEGFQESKLITDTDPQRLRALVNALAEVEIVGQVESASNFAVRHYTFEDASGGKFTFEFYGAYLKCEDKFYETENSTAFISIRPEQEKSGTLLVGLDEAHEGRGEDAGKMYLACRELEKDEAGALKKVGFGDYELSDTAEILSPVQREDYTRTQAVGAREFFANFLEVKGQENPNFIFTAEIENGVIISLHFEQELSSPQ